MLKNWKEQKIKHTSTKNNDDDDDDDCGSSGVGVGFFFTRKKDELSGNEPLSALNLMQM